MVQPAMRRSHCDDEVLWTVMCAAQLVSSECRPSHCRKSSDAEWGGGKLPASSQQEWWQLFTLCPVQLVSSALLP